MIKLTDRPLSADALKQLAKHQAQVNAKTTYADQVAAAKAIWKPQNKAFDEVVEQLIQMCPATRRCCYCEDARGEDVEHFRPKNLYPDVAFEWTNYLFACSACNSNAKRDKFAVLDAEDVLHDVTRPKDAQVIPPAAGDPALINPRFEDPLQYLRVDILRTFWFSPRRGLSTRDHRRAQYTIEVMQLNVRSELVKWRELAYRAYVGWIDTYRRYQNEGDSRSLSEHVADLKNYTHLAVWEEMKRTYRERDPNRWNELKQEHKNIREIDTLFAMTPDVLEIGL